MPDGLAFLGFLEKELIPDIEKTYRTTQPRILLGRSLSGLFTVYALLARPTAFTAYVGCSVGWPRVRHVRTRHIDAMFEESLASGANQVVILGAGLDSRPYRFGTRLAAARVFEVDFPPTQEYKKKRVKEVLGSLPAHVRYVPIDFTKDDLKTVLEARSKSSIGGSSP